MLQSLKWKLSFSDACWACPLMVLALNAFRFSFWWSKPAVGIQNQLVLLTCPRLDWKVISTILEPTLQSKQIFDSYPLPILNNWVHYETFQHWLSIGLRFLLKSMNEKSGSGSAGQSFVSVTGSNPTVIKNLSTKKIIFTKIMLCLTYVCHDSWGDAPRKKS